MNGDGGSDARRPFTRSIGRGVRHRCPACGDGQLFQGYLKPVSECATCGENLSIIRAEDGPAWLTILLLGPILVPLALFFTVSSTPRIIILPLVFAAIIAAVLLALPRVKGGFIGALWALQIQFGDDTA